MPTYTYATFPDWTSFFYQTIHECFLFIKILKRHFLLLSIALSLRHFIHLCNFPLCEPATLRTVREIKTREIATVYVKDNQMLNI
jgi:hypothetical protein